jgi:hypothetical protein
MLGTIYIIQSPNTDKVYIGSTFQTLEERFRDHKAMSNETSSYLVIDEGDAFIELLEEVKVIDKTELRYYEQQYLELYRDIAVNEQNAFGLNEEKLREYQKKYQKKFREENKEKTVERHKKYREENKYKVECPCGSVVSKLCISHHIKTQKHQKYLENLAQE